MFFLRIIPKISVKPTNCLLKFGKSSFGSCASNIDDKGCPKKFAWNLDPNVGNAINKQIVNEFTASYGFTSLGCFFERQSVSLPGFARLLHKHSHEERSHGIQLCWLITGRGGIVKFCPILPPEPQEWDSPLEALRAALGLENTTFKGITQLLEAAKEAGDGHTSQFVENRLFDLKCITELQRYIKMLESVQNLGDVHSIDMMLQMKPDGDD